jgi:hypothetical protein
MSALTARARTTLERLRSKLPTAAPAATDAPEGPAVEDMLSPEERATIDRCRPYSLASAERLLGTIDAVEHAVTNDVPGSLVECGVWRGGSVLAMILTLQRHGVDDRDIYLYDTFEGMTEPGEHDTSPFDAPAAETWHEATAEGKQAWDYMFQPDTFGRDQVEALLLGTGYPAARLHFVVGPVETTLAEVVPPAIAVLRLDTDWYESTRDELQHLYPLISPGGVLIIDDYGHWEGARRAVDEYFEQHGGRPLLSRTDYTGRMGVKLR